MRATFVNLTKSAVFIHGFDTVQPSGSAIVLPEVCSTVDTLKFSSGVAIPIVRKQTNMDGLDLPTPIPGTLFLASGVVLASLTNRPDFLAADTGPGGVIRNEAGEIKGTTRLVSYSDLAAKYAAAAEWKVEADPNAGKSFAATDSNSVTVDGHTFVNLTPHVVSVYADSGTEPVLTVPGSAATSLRCPERVVDVSALFPGCPVPVVYKQSAPPTLKLPDLAPGSYYIVSREVARLMPDTAQLLCPDGSPHAAVFRGGRMVGTRWFTVL